LQIDTVKEIEKEN